MIKHIAFILDGNRRWARERGLPTIAGHKKGYERIHDIIAHAKKSGIKHVTFWAFSTENWKRDQEEVQGLISIFRNIFQQKLLDRIHKHKVKVCILGDMTRFPEDIQAQTQKLIDETKDYTDITVNIALNYGGRAEILRAANELLKQQAESVDEERFSSLLYTHGQPDPDLIVRTGGEQRLSGYLLWQAEYSELYFTKTYWPDFDEKAFDAAVAEFNTRQRRFGT